MDEISFWEKPHQVFTMQVGRIWLVATLFILVALGVSSQSHEAVAHWSAKFITSRQLPPPIAKPSPEEDIARYVAWMEKHGKPITDKPHEDVSLRIGDWGFFYHGDRPVGSWTPLRDRTGLDRNGHAVTNVETGDWFTFLSTEGLDAASALKRVAWLFNAGGLNPADEPKGRASKITAPTLIPKEGFVTFQGWWQAYSDPPYSRRITITAAPANTKLMIDR